MVPKNSLSFCITPAECGILCTNRAESALSNKKSTKTSSHAVLLVQPAEHDPGADGGNTNRPLRFKANIEGIEPEN